MTKTDIASSSTVELPYQSAGASLYETDNDHPESRTEKTNHESNGTATAACRKMFGCFGEKRRFKNSLRLVLIVGHSTPDRAKWQGAEVCLITEMSHAFFESPPQFPTPPRSPRRLPKPPATPTATPNRTGLARHCQSQQILLRSSLVGGPANLS